MGLFSKEAAISPEVSHSIQENAMWEGKREV
jgi:hypothetical protein